MICRSLNWQKNINGKYHAWKANTSDRDGWNDVDVRFDV